MQRRGVLLPEERAGRRDRAGQQQRHAGGGVHLMIMPELAAAGV